MKVCKFGGSSLANAAQLNKVIDIVLADPARRIVVVSAPGKRDKNDTKVTDLLIALAKTALDGKKTDAALAEVVARYAEMAAELKLGDEIVKLIEADLVSRLEQVSKLEPAEFMDLLKAAGEDNNAKLVAVAFEARGKKARYASPKDTGMVVEGKFGARSRELRQAREGVFQLRRHRHLSGLLRLYEGGQGRDISARRVGHHGLHSGSGGEG